MAQHDYDIANQSGANFRADLNNALDAIVSNNSGSSEPSTTFAYEWWIDTSANVLKLRNSANNAWITLPLSITADNSTSGALTVNGNLSTTGTLDVNGGEVILDADADTSITADTDDQIDFKIGATDVMTLTNSHLVLKGTTPKITIGDGGEEDTALIFDGNAQDFYIGLDDSADDLVIGTGSTVGTNPKVVVENGGNVGIGEASPLGLLHVKSGESSGSADSNADELVIEGSGNHGIQFLGANNSFMQLLFGDSDDSDVGYLAYDHTNNAMSFGVNAGERFRVDSSGNFGVGTSSPGEKFSVEGDGAFIEITHPTGTSFSGMKFSEGGVPQGSLQNIGSTFSTVARRGNFEIFHNTGGNLTLQHGGGNVVVGGTTAFDADTITLGQGGFLAVRQTGAEAMELRRDSTDGRILEFRKDGTLVGSVSTNTNALPSDRNFKRDISDLDLGLNLVTKLKPSQYCYKVSDENSPKMYGLIAQDLQESLTQVGIEKNSTWLLQHEPNDDENESDYYLDYTKLIPILINSIQELEERIKTLEV